MAPVLEQARDAEAVRAGVTVNDILALANGVAPAGTDVEQARPRFTIVGRGMETSTVRI